MKALLKNIHNGLKAPDNEHFLMISGSYDYYHYQIDGTDDIGWGCGYRTLQTIASWLLTSTTINKHEHNNIPSLNRIQEILVEIGDKPSSFVCSRNWIGTFEAFLVLDHLYDVPCKMVHLQKGKLQRDKLSFLMEHFQKFKSPVMMGGDVDNASKCILALIMSNPMRKEVINLYKQLLFLGREYPLGGDYFKKKLKSAFIKNKDVTDPEAIKKLIDRGNYVIKELEALYMLRKYRTLKKRYYEDQK